MPTKIQPSHGDDAAATAPETKTELPVMEIPGSYGVPFLSPIRDRLDFYYFQGHEGFFTSRVQRYGSTVFRVNMPPGPFMASNPQVVAVLDAKSFPVLFDMSKVEKRDVFTGTYMPSTSFTGGFRVGAYLDPSEPAHAKIKSLVFSLLASRKNYILPAFLSSYAPIFDAVEAQLASAAGAKADFNKFNDGYALDFVGDAFFGSKPSLFPDLGKSAVAHSTKWLFPQLAPLVTLGLPKIIEEIFLHTFPLPAILVRSDYKALYSYFSSAAAKLIDEQAPRLGISPEEACNNLLFATVLNAFGGMKALFPGILAGLAKAGAALHARIASEVRAAVRSAGGKITLGSIESMDLVKSVVYEALRIDPPVPFQYGKAKKDLVVESHDAAYEVKKGEMLLGYQPLATKDARVFGPSAGEFVGDRFVGEKGKELLKYVYWSNGRETESPTVDNKQCAAKDMVVFIGRLLVAEFFLRYDTFTAEVGTILLSAQVTITSLTKATPTSHVQN